MDEAAGTFRAEGSVESRLRLASGKQQAPQPGALFDPSKLVEGKSDTLDWRRAERLVTYSGKVSLKQESSKFATFGLTLPTSSRRADRSW